MLRDGEDLKLGCGVIGDLRESIRINRLKAPFHAGCAKVREKEREDGQMNRLPPTLSKIQSLRFQKPFLFAGP